MLDPLDVSNSPSEEQCDSKAIIQQDLFNSNNNSKIGGGNSGESDEEQNIIDHLSPQTLLETPTDGEVQYSVRSAEGDMITYRVLQVEEDSSQPEDGVASHENAVSNASTGTVTQIQQVVTATGVNGQLYLIGTPPGEVYPIQATHVSQQQHQQPSHQTTVVRSLAPHPSRIDGAQQVGQIKRPRDERRRATHNEVERRRRDKINNWITKLSKIIPDNRWPELKGTASHYDGQSKGGILAKACEYILELRESEEKNRTLLKENKQLIQNTEILNKKILNLEQENKALKDTLQMNGISLPGNIL